LSSVPQFCMFTSFVSSVLYAISLNLNFLGCNNNTSQITMIVFREWIFVTWLAPVLVFPFYWTELVSNPSTNLKAAKWPLIASVFIILGLIDIFEDLIDF
jgi:uncharacterized membrane protein (DUF373 family)